MSELISEIEAFIAWKNGSAVEIYDESMCWHPLHRDHGLCVFDSNGRVKFRLKPKTITLNSIEVPAPFEPKEGDEVWFISNDHTKVCATIHEYELLEGFKLGAWRTEEEIKQVVAALRTIFKGE